MKNLTFMRNILFSGGYPPYIIFFVTSRCNMRCKHCFYWKDLGACKNELSLEEIEKISSSLPNLFFLRVTGGEPFLRHDLYEVIKHFYRNSSIKRIGINTNGSLTNEIIETTEKIVSNLKGLILEVGISIDNLNEKHDEWRSSAGAFAKAINTYDALIKIREKNANLRLGFLMTMARSNQNDLGRVFQYLQSKHPDSIGLNIIRGKPEDASELDIDIDKYNELRFLLNKYNFKNYARSLLVEKMRLVKTVISQDAIIKTAKTQKAQFQCLAGDKIAVLYPDGEVCACELLDSSIGNIRDYNCDFQNLWQAKRRKKIIHSIKKDKCCCTHECFITAGLIFNFINLFRILIKTYLSPALINHPSCACQTNLN